MYVNCNIIENITGEKMATIKDVANLAGVSVSTVSVIINNKAEERKISTATREKVEEAIKQLNYQPSISARKLRSNESNVYTVGVFWASDFRMSFLSRFMSGLQSEILKLQMPIDIAICPYESDKLRFEKRLYSLNTYNAVIIANTTDDDNDYINNNPLPIPTVMFNRESEIYHTVGIDNEEAGKKAAVHLMASGVKSVNIICQKKSYLAMSRRSGAFLNECLKNNININDIIYVEGSIAGGAEAGNTLISRGNLPDAVFCDSDSIAQGLIYALKEHSISVPQQIKVMAVGMGSPEFSRFFIPSISVVDIPMEKMAAKCMKIITEVASHELTVPSHTIYESVLHERESTRSIKH
ncbi:putative HTH-type transcriptional repressor ExuR [bioreactor metagenome]|uniref:Putative HTH-type transcriptional repressor ExuR n=1 Tax=bioreactor metagenome TaxID=1076179 RepID=A0A644XFM8_9ZZZZ